MSKTKLFSGLKKIHSTHKYTFSMFMFGCLKVCQIIVLTGLWSRLAYLIIKCLHIRQTSTEFFLCPVMKNHFLFHNTNTLLLRKE